MPDDESELRRVLDLISDAIVVVEAGPIVVPMNTAAHRLIGSRSPELIDSTGADILDCFPIGRRSPVSKGLPETQATLRLAGSPSTLVSVIAGYDKGPDNRVLRVVCAIRPATAALAMDVRTSELISTVSHEIRSPLTAVKGFTQTLLARWELFDDRTKKEMLAAVSSDADRIKRLLDELLDVSRLDSGKLTIHPHLFDLAELAQKIAKRFRATSSEHEIVVSGLPSVEVNADPDKIEQVLSNLVENALKYTDSGRIYVDVSETGISVTDSGRGIDAGMLPRVFRKFARDDRTGKPSGTGLGLYIARRLAVAHGGDLTVTSVPGQGATFTLSLPK